MNTMQDDVILDKVIKIISKVINVEEKQISINSDIKNTALWDSFNHIVLVMQICEEFSIDLSQFIILEFTSVRKICNFIKRRRDG